jgi:hypothetical protein
VRRDASKLNIKILVLQFTGTIISTLKRLKQVGHKSQTIQCPVGRAPLKDQRIKTKKKNRSNELDL